MYMYCMGRGSRARAGHLGHKSGTAEPHEVSPDALLKPGYGVRRDGIVENQIFHFSQVITLHHHDRPPNKLSENWGDSSV
jgi:hypothetical protein